VTVRSRLSAAFSLRKNLRALFVPAPGHLRPLDGLRALSILWVAVFHAGFYSIWYVPHETYLGWLGSPLFLPMWRGDFGVDIFFVLSGFLVAGMLIEEREKTGKVRLGLFQLRRFLRTWPTLFVALLIDLWLFWDNPDVAWANLIYVSNFVTVGHICMGWTWSLSIEEQFYALSPWLLYVIWPLSIPKRLMALAGIGLLLGLVAADVVVRAHYRPFETDIVMGGPIERWIQAFDDLYTKPWMRGGPILAGVAAAIAYRDPRLAAGWVRARVGAVVGLVLAVAVAIVAVHWPFAQWKPRPIQVLYVASYRSAFGLAVAYIMLFSLSDHPLGKAIGRLLSLRFLYPIGQLAYSAYLVNPMVTTLVDRRLALWVMFHQISPMRVFLPLELTLTFASAMILHLTVERPILNLRPRAP
jgi:peptidoglycan/LPS O-acetylase OafA/YrhL